MQESFSNSAGRHLQDAQILLNAQRWDNAVYLAGYVVECSFKVLVEQYFKHDQGAVKKYGHDLTELEGRAMERLRVLYPILDNQLPALRIVGTVLGQYHPDRRYSKTGLWAEAEARNAVQRAEEIYREILPKLVLNGSISSQDI
ncbi:HEPN domain-containing protein [Nodularia sp. NIES-3585]|uniref:HEPN domain-containing protein n=1 Tax=Nodularia sp. NIES-3585 TaxID=1973477 RepID=UPI000B5C4B98|nr:HEPN domain-containing protein [Nodularia sp. NIES-3585]GAX36596.1 HEPN domain protein [Nodularia sp. NIES-3585]